MFNGRKKLILFDNSGTISNCYRNPACHRLLDALRKNGHDIGIATSGAEFQSWHRETFEDLGIDIKTGIVYRRAPKSWPEFYQDVAVERKINVEDIVLVDDGQDEPEATCDADNRYVQAINEAGGTGVHFYRDGDAMSGVYKRFEKLGIL